MDILISNLLSESILDFGKWHNWNYANYTNWRNWRNFSCTTSRSPKLIPKADLKSEYPDFYSNFLERFNHPKFFLKNWFPILFSKSDLGGGGGRIFWRNKLLKKPNTSGYAQVLVVTWAKLNSITALLSPRPSMAFNLFCKATLVTQSNYFCLSEKVHLNCCSSDCFQIFFK